MSQPRRWRPLAIVAALIVGLVLSAGTGGNRARTTVSASSPATHNQAQVTLKVWDQFTDPGDAAAANTVDAAFMAAHPTIEIRREAFATDQMRQTVKTALASGTGPDVIFYDAGPGYAGVLAQAGLIRPLDDVAARHGWTHRILAASRQGATINGKLYGLPLQVDLIGVYYNKTLMD
jgi:raffinose/stachyose/melibiose transport system substrate-binding protein